MAGAVIDELAFCQVPYVKHGREMDGADCWGFVRLVAASIGVDLPRHNDVSVADPDACAARIEDLRDGFYSRVDRGRERAGDLVHLWSMVGGKRRDLHIGIVSRPGRMMHLERIGGVKAVPLRHSSVADRVIGIYRFHGSSECSG